MGKQRNPKKMHFHSDLEKVLFSANDIATRVAEIGQQLATDCRDERPLLLAALSGASIFLSDLARAITPVPEGLHLDFVRASSYHGTSTSTSGNVEIAATQKIPVKGRHVLLVEDIVDTGKTALRLKELLLSQGANSVRLVTLLDKAARRTCDIQPDYCCFPCPDEFVVGYGLDYDENYRSLPVVGVLKPALYQ